jgi:hypothetical protein
MRMAGFTAEASVYRTTERYYMGGAPVQNDRGVYPALQFICPHPKPRQVCPSRCISDCVHNCLRDNPGSLNFCNSLCLCDCSTYSSLPLSCGPCVNQLQTCTLCGGQTVTELCCDVPCGRGCCPDAGDSCCGGIGCCSQGDICITLPFVDPFCVVNPFFRKPSEVASPGTPSVVPLKPPVVHM